MIHDIELGKFAIRRCDIHSDHRCPALYMPRRCGCSSCGSRCAKHCDKSTSSARTGGLGHDMLQRHAKETRRNLAAGAQMDRARNATHSAHREASRALERIPMRVAACLDPTMPPNSGRPVVRRDENMLHRELSSCFNIFESVTLLPPWSTMQNLSTRVSPLVFTSARATSRFRSRKMAVIAESNPGPLCAETVTTV
jgi:hypothetical protein